MKNLKRLLVWCFAIVGLAGFALVGCGKSQANNVAVTAYVWDSTQEQYVQAKADTVDAHNGLVLDIPETIPDGKEFYGWSTSQNWQEGSSDFVIEGSYVRYADVKNVARDGKISLYPAFKTKVEYYFVFGVYVNSKSGIGDEQVSAIRTAVLNYLEAQQGATAEQLALVDIRQYTDSGVADYGAKIMQQGDVDVLVGCGNNINNDPSSASGGGGVAIVAKSGSFTINTKTGRRFILLNYDDLSIAVYNWFQTYIHDTYDNTFVPSNFVKTECTVTYELGENAHAEAVVPQSVMVYNNQKITLPQGPAAAENYQFAGWQVGSDLNLKAAGTEITITETVTITAQYKSGNTVTYDKGLESRAAANAPAAVGNLADGANVTLPEGLEPKAGFTFAGWRVPGLDEIQPAGTQITVNADMTITAEYTVNAAAVDDTTIIIAYFAKTDNSGLSTDDGIMDNVLLALKTYLTSINITTGHESITLRAYTNKASTSTTEINDHISNNGDKIGVVVGYKTTTAPTYIARTDGYTFGIGESAQNNRSVHLISDSAINNIVYDWMATGVGPENGTFGGVEGITMPA